MSVTVSMPQLGESVTEGTVTRWLKREGEHVEADEPLLEVSTDKVDTEIPSPVSGILRGITVAEDETVAVGAELAVIDEDGSAGAAAAPPAAQEAAAPPPPTAAPAPAPAAAPAYEPYEPAASYETPAAPSYETPAPSYQPPAPSYQPPAPSYQPPAPSYQPPAPSYEPPAPAAAPPEPVAAPEPAPAAAAAPPPAAPPPAYQPAGYPPGGYDSGNGQAGVSGEEGEAPYVTPLVRKLAAEHGIDLTEVTGTGVGGRIRKQDVLEAAAGLGCRAASPERHRAGTDRRTAQDPARDRALEPARYH